MTNFDRSVLVLGDELELVERFVPLLRRSSLVVRRLLGPEAAQLDAEAPPDLVVLVPPLVNAGDLLGRMRAAGSAWRRTSVLLVADRSVPSEHDAALAEIANRVLPLSATSREFQAAVADLLRIAPRIAVRASVRAMLKSGASETKFLRVENVSSSGMLVRADEPLPVGSVFGFALELPSEREPVRGQAGVVRLTPESNGSGFGVGVRFLSLGGDAAERLERLAGASAEPRLPTPAGTASGVHGRLSVEELPRLEEEHAGLQRVLDEMLEQGLARRLGVADWYLTGMELGLESLSAFAAILEAVHSGRAAGSEAASRIADLAEVRKKLAEFALPQQDLRLRVEIMLRLRPAMERLLRELAETGAVAAGERSSGRRAGLVSQVVVDIKRVVSLRKSYESLRDLLTDLLSTRHLFLRGAGRRAAARICQDYGGLLAPLGLNAPERLRSRKGRRAAVAAVARESQRLDQKLAAIHDRVFGRKFRHLATGNVETDLQQPAMQQVLSDILAAGQDYLVRAFSAYRHAIELAGGDPGLLERSVSLAAAIRAQRLEAATTSRNAPRVGSARAS